MESEPLELPLQIRRREIHHFLGYPRHHEPPLQIKNIIDQIREEARHLAHGRGVAVSLETSHAVELGLPPQEAERLILGLVTIGEALEARTKDYQRQGYITAALVLDAAGSAAVEEAADRLSMLIVAGQRPVNDMTSPVPVPCRISPGYGEWPLQAQTKLFRFLPASELGVELTPTMMMVPRKSISFAILLGGENDNKQGCNACDLERCPYQRR